MPVLQAFLRLVELFLEVKNMICDIIRNQLETDYWYQFLKSAIRHYKPDYDEWDCMNAVKEINFIIKFW